MKKLFGTDGIRAQNNSDIFDDYHLHLLVKSINDYTKIPITSSKFKQRIMVIAHDTRESSERIRSILSDEFYHFNWKVCNLGISPTPMLSNLINWTLDAPNYEEVDEYYFYGIMITASHNQYSDNGIKIFNCNGLKLDKDDESNIEKIYFNLIESNYQKDPMHILSGSLGEIYWHDISESKYHPQYYKNYNINGLKLAIDCAHGATVDYVSDIFKKADLKVINKSPNGKNINKNCGSQYPKKLSKFILKNNIDVGIAFDGDGDRLVVVDEKGKILTGDHILAICAKYYKENNMLDNDTLVVTQMSNLGLHNSMKKLGIKVISTDVGDRNVFKEMRKSGAILGGENSGHIIFSKLSSTGDGMLSALVLLDILNKEKKPLSELSKCIKIYPQVLINVEVSSKPALDKLISVQDLILDAESQFKDKGRVFIRYSGTESICRVMIEGEDKDLVKKTAKLIAGEIERLIG